MKSYDIFLEQGADQIICTEHANASLNYPMHVHEALELVFCEKGTFMLYLEQDSHEMAQGSLALIPQMAAHGFSGSKSCSCSFIFLPEQLLRQIEGIELLTSYPEGAVFHADDAPSKKQELYQTLRNLVNQEDLQLAGYYAMILLTYCLRTMKTQTVRPRSNAKDLQMRGRILLFIQQHYHETLTLEQIGRTFGISKCSVSRIINNGFRATLPELTNKFRMIEADWLLTQTQMPVTQIAAAVGYDSLCCFNRNYRKHFGTCPRERRKNCTS